ncbi:MAG: SAM-dependent DNA methyltransferase [Butyrivibrio sp.]|uniref:HsdM family class I SAM-dependent methyltransferase n=1 Tax=Butyrivibrio sp. TaxID=28121 RepID=UPI001B43BFD4|nr:N-6 DNA methylase [Butyrivibrio sp.]MBP3783236.1 SAM-dependent DNA methyltransferase [Butyrivibrio sp.]
MAQFLTEDEVRDADKFALGFNEKEKGIQQGTGQITTFNQLGIKGVSDKPDGWYIPDNKNAVAILLETKNSNEDIGTKKIVDEIKKNCQILMNAGYKKVVGILHNGYKSAGFFNNEPIDIPNEIQPKKFYIDLVNEQGIPTQKIYDVTRSINNNLHVNFGVKNLYHRMIFTACALVAQRYGARLESLKDRDFSMLHGQILSTINKSLEDSKQQNMKLHILEDVYQKIEMNYTENQKAINDFIDDVCTISDCVNSNEWRGEDVMGIFFNEFNRYKKKSEAGQVFTPEHITSFMYRLIGVTQNDYLGDFTCGSGAFLVKGMSNMMREAGGYDTNKSKEIRKGHLFGIEFDKEIYALACANMLIHKDGKTNLDQNDMRTDSACEWIKSKPITKVLMNPPYENKYGCMTIVENVLDSVKAGTDCAFILPDKKLEKASKTQIKRILENHTLTKIIKLPEPLFFGVGVTTSIFVFKTGQPQNGQEIFGCYIEDDGLETVKNEGRQDIKHKWKAIEDYWIDSIGKLRDPKHNTTQWINPNEHLSYQMPEKPFEISEKDFKKTAMDYICFKNGIDTKEFGEKLLNAALYGSEVTSDNTGVNIKIGGGSND